MATPFAVIMDNDALINLSAVDKHHRIFQKLSLIFSKIHIPSEIFVEFENGAKGKPERDWLIKILGYSSHPIWVKCSEYDSWVHQLYKTEEGIDSGEAAALAQFRKIGARYIISDDKNFTDKLNHFDKTVKVISSLQVLCWLDLHGYLPTWEGCLRSYHQESVIKSQRLRECYKQAALALSINVGKKTLSLKTSLKNLGIGD